MLLQLSHKQKIGFCWLFLCCQQRITCPALMIKTENSPLLRGSHPCKRSAVWMVCISIKNCNSLQFQCAYLIYAPLKGKHTINFIQYYECTQSCGLHLEAGTIVCLWAEWQLNSQKNLPQALKKYLNKLMQSQRALELQINTAEGTLLKIESYCITVSCICKSFVGIKSAMGAFSPQTPNHLNQSCLLQQIKSSGLHNTTLPMQSFTYLTTHFSQPS